MSKNLIEVGLSVIHGPGRATGLDQAAKDLIRRALSTTDLGSLQVRCVLLLATADWCQFPGSISERIRFYLKKRLGYEVPLIGGSMAGFYCSTDPEPIVRQGLGLLALCSDHLWVSVEHFAEPYAKTPFERAKSLTLMAQTLEKKAGARLGASADRFLLAFFPGVVSDQGGLPAYYDNELHREIVDAFGYRYRIVGASTADQTDPTVGFQFADDQCLKSGLAVGLVETDLATAATMAHGFAPSSPRMRVSVDGLVNDAESGYRVSRLDGKAASERLLELKQSDQMKSGTPLFGLPCGEDFHIIWPKESDDKSEEVIWFKRKVSRGDRLYVLNASPDEMLKSAERALQRVSNRTRVTKRELSFILGFSCAGRLSYYRSQRADWKDVINRLRESYLGIPLIWGLSAGEFGVDQWRRLRSNNMSLTLTCVTNSYATRARTRKLQLNLLRAASHLATSESPVNAMQIALSQAITCGATGGQICVVDRTIGRIVGKEFGSATPKQQSGEDWIAVAHMTDREAAKGIGGEFPSYLRDWSLPVVSDTPVHATFPNETSSASTEEDILSLVVRTHQAVFIPNCKDPRFHCDQTAIKKGNIRCQLVVPLIGSQGRAIATLQLSFPEGTQLDRESLALWVGYGQQAASTLERTQESEEKGILQQISLLAESIMQTPVDIQPSPYAWCDQFIRHVVELLGADGGHIRMASQVTDGYEYSLISVIGLLADLLPLTRQVIRDGTATYNMEILRSGGCVSNTKQDTHVLNEPIKALENASKYGRALSRKLAEIESHAALPLYDRKQVLGSLVLYANHPYLFTERRLRIARSAAAIAGAVLRAKKADYERMQLDRERSRLDVERTWILDSLISVTEGTARQRLLSLLKSICTTVSADVASVFTWYDTPKKLILHTSYNWHKGMEGRAEYETGEGWTGNLAIDKEEVTIAIRKGSEARLGDKKYYDMMVPPEHRVGQNDLDTRIGIRLIAGENLVGVVTFLYYKENSKYLEGDKNHIIEFLRPMTRLITLAAELASREATQKRAQTLFEMKNNVATDLIQPPDHEEGWRSILERMMKGFNVERVTFYFVRPDRKIQIGWYATAPHCSAPVRPFKAFEAFGELGDLIYHNKREVFIHSESDPRLNQWPNGDGIKTLCAVPVVTAKSNVAAVLEFVNRTESYDHPFGYFDRLERNVALDVARYFGAALDQHEHEKEVNELTSRLTTATKIGATGLFGTIVMHQLMNQFSNIRGAIDWLLRHKDNPSEDRARYLKRIEGNCSQAVQIIEEAAHRGTIGHRLVSLRTVVRQAVRTIEPELPVPGIKLKLNAQLDDSKILVNVDLWSVVGALVNILSNAIDAMNGTGVLTVETSAQSDVAVIRIHNTGPALTESQISQIFSPGYSTKPSTAGHLGFGLPLAKQAIEAAGGDIGISSSTGRGVEVILTLPTTQNGRSAPMFERST